MSVKAGQVFLDDLTLDGDVVRDFNGVRVDVDQQSAPYLSGTVIDFEDTFGNRGFTIDNPNTKRS
jgi:Fe-S cluster assembly iron-binding protein IscA